MDATQKTGMFTTQSNQGGSWGKPVNPIAKEKELNIDKLEQKESFSFANIKNPATETKETTKQDTPKQIENPKAWTPSQEDAIKAIQAVKPVTIAQKPQPQAEQEQQKKEQPQKAPTPDSKPKDESADLFPTTPKTTTPKTTTTTQPQVTQTISQQNQQIQKTEPTTEPANEPATKPTNLQKTINTQENTTQTKTLFSKETDKKSETPTAGIVTTPVPVTQTATSTPTKSMLTTPEQDTTQPTSTTVNLDDMVKTFKANEKNITINNEATPNTATLGELNLQNLSLKKGKETPLEESNPLATIATIPQIQPEKKTQTTPPTTDKKKSTKTLGVVVSMLGFILLVGASAFVAHTMYPEESKSLLAVFGVNDETTELQNDIQETDTTTEKQQTQPLHASAGEEPSSDTVTTGNIITNPPEQEEDTEDKTSTGQNIQEDDTSNEYTPENYPLEKEEITKETETEEKNTGIQEIPQEEQETTNEDTDNPLILPDNQTEFTWQQTNETEEFSWTDTKNTSIDEPSEQENTTWQENTENTNDETEEWGLTPFQDMETFIDGVNQYQKETIEKVESYKAQGEKFIMIGTEREDPILVKYWTYIVKKSERIIMNIKKDNTVDIEHIEKYFNQFDRYIERANER